MSIIRNYCISYPKGWLSTLVGDLTCLGQKFHNVNTQETQWSKLHETTALPVGQLLCFLKSLE
jgi:hypothetical protein